MAVRIRLTRVGATKRPAYRVIAIDKRRSRDGRALEILGFYDPLTEPATVQLDRAKIQDWISKGAQPSDTVVKLMRQAENDAAAAAACRGRQAEAPDPRDRAEEAVEEGPEPRRPRQSPRPSRRHPPAETPANETERRRDGGRRRGSRPAAEPAAETTDADAADEAKAEA